MASGGEGFGTERARLAGDGLRTERARLAQGGYFKSATSFSFENYERKSFKKLTLNFVKISTK